MRVAPAADGAGLAFFRAILVETGKRRGAVTTALMRRIINALDLDIDRRKDDLALAQFHARAVSESIQYVAAWAGSGRPFGLTEASWLAEQVLRSKKALGLWRGPSYHQVEKVWGLIWEAAWIIIKKGR